MASATSSSSAAGALDQRNSSRLSNDWASYMHLHTQLESAEPDPSVIVVKRAPASRQPEPTYGTQLNAFDARLSRDPSAADRRSAVTNYTDEMSEYGEDEVVLSAATRVGLHRSPSAGAAIVFNRTNSSTDSQAVKRTSSHRSSKDQSVDAPTVTNAGVGESAAPSRTSIGEDSANRNRNSNPSRFSNGTPGWQTPSETQSQQSPRSSRSVRPLTLPPAEPLPPLPSPSPNTPHLPSDSANLQGSPEYQSQGLNHSPSAGRLGQVANSVGHLPSSTSAPVTTSRTTSRALGFEIRPSPQTGAIPSPVNRKRSGTEESSGSIPPGHSSTVGEPAFLKTQISSRERDFMDRIDRPARSVTSSSETSSAATPAHLGPNTFVVGRMNGDSSSTVTSPVTPTAATMSASAAATTAPSASTSTSTHAAVSTATRLAPSAAGRAQAIFNAKTAAPPSSRANPLAGARGAASEQVHGNRPPSIVIAPGGRGLVRRASEVNLQSRRTEMEEDKVTAKVAPLERSAILKKAETRFAGAFTEVAQAFKQLQAEKLTLENIIRATTPLDGLGDQGQLSDYLKSMTAKVASSEEEIRKLLELLDQQRAVMDYMLETHERESDAHFDQIDELHAQLDSLSEEAEIHRANCVQLTAELDRAHNDAVAARSEALKLRASLQQESSKCEQAMTLLRAVQHQMKDRDQASKALRSEVESLRAREDDHKHARGRDEDMHTNLSGRNAEELSSMSGDLRRKLSSQHEADMLARSEQIRSELAAKHAEELNKYGRQLRAELTAQHKGELKSLQTKLESTLMMADADAQQRLSTANSAHETELKMLHARLAKLERDGDSKATLEAELREKKTQHVTLVNQLADRTSVMNEMEQKSRALEKEVGTLRTAAVIPVPVSGKGGSGSPESLQARVQTAEARAKAVEKVNEELNSKLTSLEEGGSKSELASLRAQLVDQRAREVQIRNAYKNLQYELRKAQQSAKSDERKRGFLTGSVGMPSGGSVSGHGNGPPSPQDGPPGGLQGLQRSSSNSSQTTRQLKRLSLPLVSKGDRVLPTNWMEMYQRENNGPSNSRPNSSSSTNFSHALPPPSSFRNPMPTSRHSFSNTPSPPERRQSGLTDGGGGDEDGRSSSTASASNAGSMGVSGGVLGYGASMISNVSGMGMSSGSASSAVAGGAHGTRPLSEASAYSIDEVGEEDEDEDEEEALEMVESDNGYGRP
ncbi:hypothetical protein CF326_g1723 [Tilletia indica]|nr:hypothetical protein CF326_g1723 [Tilletia indica]